jgi:hypothetical protein
MVSRVLERNVQLLRMDAELAGAGAEQVAFHAHDVAEVEQLVKSCIIALADGVLAHVDLQPLAVLLQVREAGLAHAAHGLDASGDATTRIPAPSSSAVLAPYSPGCPESCG